MIWHGIPFPIDSEQLVTSARLAIDRIPKIEFVSGDNTLPLIVAAITTILGSVIAGSIPAVIAWKSIKNNQRQTEIDRQSQQASFDESIRTQLKIAQSNFNAQVLSANRQAWINTLRESSSEFVSRLNALLMYHEEYFKIKNESPSSRNKQAVKEEIKLMHEKLMIHIPLLTLVAVKIELMLNAEEDISWEVIACISNLRNLADSVAHDSLGKRIKEIEEGLKLFKRLISTILKTEWSRVKEGV